MVLLCLETWMFISCSWPSAFSIQHFSISAFTEIFTTGKTGATWCCNQGTGCQEANFQTKPFICSSPVLPPPLLFPFIALFHTLLVLLHSLKCPAGCRGGSSECWWVSWQHFVVLGGLWESSPPSPHSAQEFSLLDLGTLDQAPQGTGCLVSGPCCGI